MGQQGLGPTLGSPAAAGPLAVSLSQVTPTVVEAGDMCWAGDVQVTAGGPCYRRAWWCQPGTEGPRAASGVFGSHALTCGCTCPKSGHASSCGGLLQASGWWHSGVQLERLPWVWAWQWGPSWGDSGWFLSFTHSQPDANSWLTGKDPDAGKDRRQEEKGMTEDEMVGWQHQLNGHGFEQTPEIVKEREICHAIVYGVAECDMTEGLNSNNKPEPTAGLRWWQGETQAAGVLHLCGCRDLGCLLVWVPALPRGARRDLGSCISQQNFLWGRICRGCKGSWLSASSVVKSAGFVCRAGHWEHRCSCCVAAADSTCCLCS